MDTANEITVKVNMDYSSLIKLLLSNGFELTEKFTLDDIYYVKEDTDLSQNVLNIISNVIVLRTHTENNNEFIFLTAKNKEFAQSGEIVSQSKVDLEIKEKAQAREFLKSISYKELFSVYADISLYSKDDLGICIQFVNNEYLLIEIEEKGRLNTIDKIINALDETGIIYDKSNYFVKKAEITFNKKYR